MLLSDRIDNSMRTVAVVTGGGKTTIAVLTGIEHLSEMGSASVDKDAMTSTRQHEYDED